MRPTHVAVKIDGGPLVPLLEHALVDLSTLGFPGALLVRHGDELYVDNANVDAVAAYVASAGEGPPAECRVSLEVHTQVEGGDRPEPEVVELVAPLGCRAYHRLAAWELRDTRSWSDYRRFILDGLRREHLHAWDDSELAAVTSQTCPLGGDPDQTGSPWVSSRGCAQLLAMALTGDMSAAQAGAAGVEAHRRAGRAVYWRDGNTAPLLGRETPYLFHRGYRKGGGGSDGLYSTPVPVGIPSPTGDEPGHPTHGELELAIGLAVMTGSVHLGEAAWGTWQVWVKLVRVGDFQSSRALGRLLRTAACLSWLPGMDLDVLEADVRVVLDYQAARENAGMPSPDWEGVSSYHINLAQVDDALRAVGLDPETWPEATRKAWGNSDTCWTVAQLAHGVRSLRRCPLGHRLEAELRRLADVCAAFLTVECTAPGLSVPGGEWVAGPGANGTHEDVATTAPVRLVKGGGGMNDALGVLGRFWLPELYDLAVDRPGHAQALIGLGAAVLDRCDSERRWGSKPAGQLLEAILESQAPVVKVRGLPPTYVG